MFIVSNVLSQTDNPMYSTNIQYIVLNLFTYYLWAVFHFCRVIYSTKILARIEEIGFHTPGRDVGKNILRWKGHLLDACIKCCHWKIIGNVLRTMNVIHTINKRLVSFLISVILCMDTRDMILPFITVGNPWSFSPEKQWHNLIFVTFSISPQQRLYMLTFKVETRVGKTLMWRSGISIAIYMSTFWLLCVTFDKHHNFNELHTEWWLWTYLSVRNMLFNSYEKTVIIKL